MGRFTNSFGSLKHIDKWWLSELEGAYASMEKAPSSLDNSFKTAGFSLLESLGRGLTCETLTQPAKRTTGRTAQLGSFLGMALLGETPGRALDDTWNGK